MNEFDRQRSFDRAQRAYDNMMPPEDDTVECPECEGSGKADVSNCCGAEMDKDTLMCLECHEHCDFDECGECDGTGECTRHKPEPRERWDDDER